MSWLLITISAYFFLAISTLGDKFLLKENIPNPKVYSFYVGIAGIFALVFIPFGFFLPSPSQILLAFLVGAIFVAAFFLYISVLKEFEASRVAPAIGGLIPIFAFLLTIFFSQGKILLSSQEMIAFLLLVSGSVLIVIEKSTKIWGKSLFLSSAAAFYFALYFVSAKFVYIFIGFINGLIWIRIGCFLAALLFLSSKEVRSQVFVFNQRQLLNLQTPGIFIGNQIVGSAGAFLQNWAIALVKIAGVALVNAMQGVMYVFLFIFSFILSKKFPRILKEEISKEIIFQKIFATLIIGMGLALLAFSQ